jgi:hypothetical protein
MIECGKFLGITLTVAKVGVEVQTKRWFKIGAVVVCKPCQLYI